MSFLPANNLIFHPDTLNNFQFLVDSGASLSILPHAATKPPTNHPSLGFLAVLMSIFPARIFEFHFLQAAVATPLLGMDFLTHFGLYTINSKQQVLQGASGCTFSKASTGTASYIMELCRCRSPTPQQGPSCPPDLELGTPSKWLASQMLD
jgi:hypothetical protein